MAERYTELNDTLLRFIEKQHMFFVGTSAAGGRVSLSPKGMDTFRVTNPKEVVWLNLTGNRNETAAHVQENGRMTIMLCSFEQQPLILRLYGRATVFHPRDREWHRLQSLFSEYAGARQIFRVSIEMVQTSCGGAVPLYGGDRDTLLTWAEDKGREGIEKYWNPPQSAQPRLEATLHLQKQGKLGKHQDYRGLQKISQPPI